MNKFLARMTDNFVTHADRPYCTFVERGGETVITWREFGASCRSFARLYRQAGLPQGGQILIFLRHRPELYGAFFGAMLGGFTPSFMPCSSPRQDPKIYWHSHDALLAHIRPAALLADRATLDEMAAAGLDLSMTHVLCVDDPRPEAPDLTPAPSPDDAIGLLQHSSGTTGLKKGVALSFEAIVGQIDSYARSIRVAPDDVIVSWLPLYHDMGLIACCVMPTYLAIPVVHMDAFHWLSEPDLLLRKIGEKRGTLCWLPNFAFEHLALVCGEEAPSFDLSSMRAFIDCSEPCKPASLDRFASAFAVSGARADQMHCCYAMAETVFAVAQTTMEAAPYRLTAASRSLERGQIVRAPSADEQTTTVVECGAMVEGLDVRAYDETRRPLPRGQVGELGISGDFLFSGYNRDPERTAASIENGVYFSRDLGFVDAEGRVFVLGRVDDLIIINGRNLYAHEVEAAAAGVEGVKPGRVVAVPFFDERAGSQALVVIAERRNDAASPKAAMIKDLSHKIFSTFQVMPKRVGVVEEGWLIKTTSGKISRKENLAKLVRGE